MDECLHDSRKGKSTLSQLLEHHQEFIYSLEEEKTCNSKTLDKCDETGVMMHKLKALGVKGKLGRWINNFLATTKQQLVVKGVIFNVINLTPGVPRGTVLGPKQFLIFIYDIGFNIKAIKQVYVDDKKVSHTQYRAVLLHSDSVHCWCLVIKQLVRGQKPIYTQLDTYRDQTKHLHLFTLCSANNITGIAASLTRSNTKLFVKRSFGLLSLL